MIAHSVVCGVSKAVPQGRSGRAVQVHAIKRPAIKDVKDSFAKKRASPLESMVTYVSEAFGQIFSNGMHDTVPWVEQPAFSGSISHGRQHHGGAGYAKGFVKMNDHAQSSKNGFIVDSIGRSFFGANVNELETTSTEPRKFYSTGYTGKKYGSRRIKREVNRVSRY